MESMTKKFVMFKGYKLRVLAEDEDDFLLHCDVRELTNAAWGLDADSIDDLILYTTDIYVKLEDYIDENLLWKNKNQCEEIPYIQLRVIYD